MPTNSSAEPSRLPPLTIMGIVVIALVLGLVWLGTSPSREQVAKPEPVAPVKPPDDTVRMPDSDVQQQVAVFCGDCHRLPAADQFPRSGWEHEVKRGFQFYADSGRTDLQPPPVTAAVAYFESQAPERVMLAPVTHPSNPAPVQFKQVGFRGGDALPKLWQSTISAVNWIKHSSDGPGQLFCSDMRLGRILKIELAGDRLNATHFASIPHPTNVRATDLDGNGQLEFVVADLGSYLPEDHELGVVWWLPLTGTEEQEPERIVLFSGIGRVADVQPLDADGDGDQDLIVAEFGWHKTGGIHLLENQGMENGKPKLKPHLLDRRSGTIHVPVADLNGDGRPDFVALISQEHESVVGFLNQGNLKFEAQDFGEPQDPSIGSSGMSLVDLDGDKDLDVLLTCGDTFDSYSIKPAHGVQWLENDGNLKFKRHFIVAMPGAHRALAGDVDGDGDLDIVATAFLPDKLKQTEGPSNLDSLVFLQQTAPGEFERYRLEGAFTHHMAVEMADFDADGDLDLAVGNFAEKELDNLAPLTVWWNQRVDKTKP